MKRLTKGIATILFFSMLLTGCGGGEAEITETQVSESIEITTDYGTLYYPDQWEEFIKTEQQTIGETIVVSFVAQIQDVEYPLFEVTIGGSEGTEVGELTDEEGAKRIVYLHVNELEEDPALTEGEQNRLYAMQEDLNYLIDNLK